jgi:pyruvate dehydrogenase E2 component (dihydrolipoamide acetyltransferase)
VWIGGVPKLVEEVIMPKLGATMDKGTILEWFKNVGDHVEKGEPLLEIMTDKINIEVEATSTGVLLKQCYGVDVEVDVLKPIAYIGEVGASVPNTVVKPSAALEVLEAPSSKEEKQETISHLIINKPRRTPAARKLALENGIDLAEVTGSGPNQRIQVSDIENILRNRRKATPLAKEIARKQEKDLSQITGTRSQGKITKQDVQTTLAHEGNKTLLYEGMRKIIGERMTKSAQDVPHVTLHCEVDVSQILDMRSELVPKVQKRTGVRLSLTDIFVKFTAHTLKKHPMLNTTFKGDMIEVHSNINIGLAVDVPNGLVVPVIKQADQKSLAEIAQQTKELIHAAQNHKLSYEQISGATFSISNLGMFAVDSFNPIINEPEAAILGIGRIREQMVKRNGSIDSIQQVTLNLSFDHRVMDGATAARFLTDLKNALEDPYELFI